VVNCLVLDIYIELKKLYISGCRSAGASFSQGNDVQFQELTGLCDWNAPSSDEELVPKLESLLSRLQVEFKRKSKLLM